VGGGGTGSEPLDGAAVERALHCCRRRESGDGEAVGSVRGKGIADGGGVGFYVQTNYSLLSINYFTHTLKKSSQIIKCYE
jgi:hypothetical protein